MFVVNRNGYSLYPNQLIMMNAIMSDVLSHQRNYITGNNYNDQIIKTQSIVAGLFDDSEKPPVKPMTPEVMATFKPIIKDDTVTKEQIEKNNKVFAVFENTFKLIENNFENLKGLDSVKDASIIKKIEQLKKELIGNTEIIKMAKDNKIILTDNQLLVINKNLDTLLNEISTLRSHV